MALSASTLKGLIESEMTAQGFDISNPFCFASKLAAAISKAVVDHIVADAELVPVSTDSGTAGSGIVTGKVK